MKKPVKIALGVAGGLIIITAIAGASGGGNTNSEPKRQAKYEAVVENYLVQDPATLTVRVKAHNVGNAPGKPSCTIAADNGTRAYHGFDTFVRETDLGPDEYWGFNGNITITNEGAEHIKEVTASCK
jgi:hypothetical protein